MGLLTSETFKAGAFWWHWESTETPIDLQQRPEMRDRIPISTFCRQVMATETAGQNKNGWKTRSSI